MHGELASTWLKVRKPVGFGVITLKLVYRVYSPAATPCFTDPTNPFDQWKFFFLLKLLSCKSCFQIPVVTFERKLKRRVKTETR